MLRFDERGREEAMRYDGGDLRLGSPELGESTYVIAMPRTFPRNKLASHMEMPVFAIAPMLGPIYGNQRSADTWYSILPAESLDTIGFDNSSYIVVDYAELVMVTVIIIKLL